MKIILNIIFIRIILQFLLLNFFINILKQI